MAETHSLQDMRQQAAVAAKVFIQRDYTNGTVCHFQTKFPSELESRIDKQQFEETVRTLNNLYAEAEKLGSQSYIEGCLACLTAYIIFLCMETHYEKARDVAPVEHFTPLVPHHRREQMKKTACKMLRNASFDARSTIRVNRLPTPMMSGLGWAFSEHFT
ncbi:golgin subfamily A member 7-like isoform X3 [Anarrhichthys ocellatus]|uniref:golgin subfamily A member 7-like isoform X3 n=1 Tax=Anarrhichthys ocellatus TaxID=433405 RepID=UPI0012EE9EDE|nr:golgin subfamily A member 7-like isoform X3 [Anarrhichthys ocellatus]